MTLSPDKLTLLGEISETAYQLQAVTAGTHHPAGTGRPEDLVLAEWEHREIERLRSNGCDTWAHELRNATADVYAADGWTQLRAALINLAATSLCWLIDGDQTPEAIA